MSGTALITDESNYKGPMIIVRWRISKSHISARFIDDCRLKFQRFLDDDNDDDDDDDDDEDDDNDDDDVVIENNNNNDVEVDVVKDNAFLIAGDK